MEMRYGPDNCQRLQFSDSVIFLSDTQGSAGIGDWMHIPVILVLFQYGSNAMDRGASLQHGCKGEREATGDYARARISFQATCGFLRVA